MDNNQNEENNEQPQAIRGPGVTRLSPLSSADDLVEKRRAEEKAREQAEAERIKATQEQAEAERAKTAQEQPSQEVQNIPTTPVRNDIQQPNSIYPTGAGNPRSPQSSALSQPNTPPARPIKDPLWIGVLGFFIWPLSIVAIILGNEYRKQTGNGTARTLGIIACVLGLLPFIVVILTVIFWILGLAVMGGGSTDNLQRPSDSDVQIEVRSSEVDPPTYSFQQ